VTQPPVPSSAIFEKPFLVTPPKSQARVSRKMVIFTAQARE